MKIITAGVTSAMLAAGLVGSVAAYRTQADPADVMRPAAEATAAETAEEAPEAAKRPRPKVRWEPCPQGSTLERGTCVTDVVRTVVLPAPSPTAQPTPAAPLAATTQPQDDDSDHGNFPDDHDDESADHESADHEDEGDEDEGHEDEGHEDEEHESDDHEDED